MVAVVEPHVFQQGDRLPAALGNLHRSGGLRQPDDRRGFRRQGGGGQAGQKDQGQQKGQNFYVPFHPTYSPHVVEFGTSL